MQSGSLKFEQVSKEYTGQFVINSISLQFNPGEITLLIGANGSGKSTLLRIAAGLVTPNSGAVERAQDIVGYLGHRTSLYLHLTVAENLQFWSRLLYPCSESNPSEIDVLMKQWNLTQYRNRFVNELSKGVQTRLGLARAFSGDPKTILLDEPTSSLDEESVTTLSELLKQRAHSGWRGDGDL